MYCFCKLIIQVNPRSYKVEVITYCLKKTFKQINGCTITEYIQQTRIGQAEFLLSNTDLSIAQIAKTVGYSNASRFAELFQRNIGILPGEYRKILH